MLQKELANSWLKIGRADEHAKTVSDEFIAWKKTNPYEVLSQRQAGGSHYRMVLRFNSRMVLERWALICGDCIHNLRSALDHLVYAIAVREAGVDPPPDERRIQFPIADSPAEFSIQETRRLQSFSPAVRAVLESVQPYNRHHRALPPLLGVLRDFDDRDKHRLLNIADHWQHSGKVDVSVPPGYRLRNVQVNTGSLVDGSELVSFDVTPPTRDVQSKYHINVSIGLDHGAGPSGVKVTAIDSVLSLLSEEVKTVIDVVARKL